MFSFIKSKLLLIGGGIIVFLLAALKVLSFQNKRNKKRAERAEGQLQFKEDVDTLDSEIEQTISRRAEVANEDREEGKTPNVIRNPNDY